MKLLVKTLPDQRRAPDDVVRVALSSALSASWGERVEVTPLFPGSGGNRGRMVSIALPDEATVAEVQELKESLASDPRLEYVEEPARKRLVGAA